MRENFEQKYVEQVNNLGRAALHALFPKDFEYYALSLELCDSSGAVVDFFSWPIMPQELYEAHKEITKVSKTMGGVSVGFNATFNPRPITIKGDFGTRFKVLLGGQNFEFGGIHIGLKQGKFSVSGPNLLQNSYPQFSSFAKTGYGCIKVVEAIKEKSKQLDSYGKPFSLYLYNPVLGNNYQVVFDSFTHGQDKANHNMLPYYEIQMTAVAPLDSVFSRLKNLKSSVKNVSFSALQKRATQLAGPVTKALSKVI
jgi:hypothetical protein